ncbi:MAG: class I SAM-dependent RNA methyltransferase [Clostridium sp.]|nr:class I SAM-dependent RNA methyltransferase [Clostridium sp.]MCM1546767.1 class I SAM-dependent RNA methyltransferase [Ruminococcus sp.]
MNNRLKLTCPCHFGLESVLKFEANKIGGENITVRDGRVSFEGGFDMLARANICLSTAERVLIELAEFKAVTFEELFQGVKKIPLEEFIGAKDAFPVKGHSLNSALHSVPDCQSIIKKAAVERLKNKYHISWFEETEAVHQIQFSIIKDNVTIYLDTSGAGLHKRGYRKNANAAPIKETLAAGIVDLARVRSSSLVCDPFCGSGTILIEAALKALNIPPCINRRFAAEKWSCINEKIWREERQRAISLVNKNSEFKAWGFDIDDEAVSLSIENAGKAGVRSRIRIDNADIRDYSPSPGVITFCNPPYGERMLEIREAEQLYTEMGKVMNPSAENPCYIISPHEKFENFFGKKADKKRKLYNGMIKCNLYMYFK